MGGDDGKVDMKKRIIIFGNGRLSKKFLTYIQPGDYIIGVDRAAYWLIAHGVVPDMAIGDFDSTSQDEWKKIKKIVSTIKQFTSKKDWTDMELAVSHAVELAPQEVMIFGGTGTRLDHSLASLELLDKLLKAKVRHVLIDETNRVRIIGRGRTILKRGEHRYVSIFPYTTSVMLTLNGFRYNVQKSTMFRGVTIGVSNEIVGADATIEIFSGKTWVIESNDDAVLA